MIYFWSQFIIDDDMLQLQFIVSTLFNHLITVGEKNFFRTSLKLKRKESSTTLVSIFLLSWKVHLMATVVLNRMTNCIWQKTTCTLVHTTINRVWLQWGTLCKEKGKLYCPHWYYRPFLFRGARAHFGKSGRFGFSIKFSSLSRCESCRGKI